MATQLTPAEAAALAALPIKCNPAPNHYVRALEEVFEGLARAEEYFDLAGISGPDDGPCETCDGTGKRTRGAIYKTIEVACERCAGTGFVGASETSCERCGGTGEIVTDACPACNGHGHVETEILPPYEEARLALLKVYRDVRELQKHVHQWTGDDYCAICGADGRA